MFVFESTDGMMYNCPDMFIFLHKNQRVEWGSELIMHPVYCKGGSLLTGKQTIHVTFSHEGGYGGSLDATWLQYKKKESWYGQVLNSIHQTKMIDVDRLVRFDLGSKHPLFFKTKEDLGWYITNIYPLDYISVEDGMD